MNQKLSSLTLICVECETEYEVNDYYIEDDFYCENCGRIEFIIKPKGNFVTTPSHYFSEDYLDYLKLAKKYNLAEDA